MANMANSIQTTNLSSKTFVASTSRYVNSSVIYYGPQNKITFKTYKKSNYKSGSDDKYMVIPPGLEYRPDLISQRAYGISDFWWKIMEANNISDVFDLKSGVNLRVPPII